jgi:hypothetical protein
MERLWKVRIGDTAFHAAPQIYVAQGFLAFARLVGGDQEVRALRYAIREGYRAGIYAPWSTFPDEYADLDPGLRIQVEPIWIQGLPRFRVALYLPVIRSGEETLYFFLPFGDPATEFARFVEAVTLYPAPDLSCLGGEDLRRRLIRDGVSTIPVISGTGPEGFLIQDDALREILADLARDLARQEG